MMNNEIKKNKNYTSLGRLKITKAMEEKTFFVCLTH